MKGVRATVCERKEYAVSCGRMMRKRRVYDAIERTMIRISNEVNTLPAGVSGFGVPNIASSSSLCSSLQSSNGTCS